MCKTFGIGVEPASVRECGRNCRNESNKNSKDSGALHDKERKTKESVLVREQGKREINSSK